MTPLKSLGQTLRSVKSGVRRMLKPAEGEKKGQIFMGLPEHLDEALLQQVCKDYFSSGVQSARYHHLSAWKSAGAYRLLLQLENSRRLQLIYKEAVYDNSHIPALQDCPVQPGLPEHVIFNSHSTALKEILPQVYLAHEAAPGLRYQYLLEDLQNDYQPVNRSEAIQDALIALPTIHQALAEWASQEHPQNLLRYGNGYQDELFDYTRAGLEEYAQQHPSEQVNKALTALESMRSLYQREIQPMLATDRVIHGDLNHTNIFIHKDDPTKIKVIDWEWAGTGAPHSDLVSLMKGYPAATEQEALRQFAQQNPQTPAREHNCIYQWCKIERGLLDAGFLAKQAIHNTHETNFSLHSAVSGSINRALSAYQALSG
jgi:hypothetical protein